MHPELERACRDGEVPKNVSKRTVERLRIAVPRSDVGSVEVGEIGSTAKGSNCECAVLLHLVFELSNLKMPVHHVGVVAFVDFVAF